MRKDEGVQLTEMLDTKPQIVYKYDTSKYVDVQIKVGIKIGLWVFRSNGVVCLCPDKEPVFKSAYRVLKVRLSFPVVLYMYCKPL